jgi:hypothetical protein
MMQMFACMLLDLTLETKPKKKCGLRMNQFDGNLSQVIGYKVWSVYWLKI